MADSRNADSHVSRIITVANGRLVLAVGAAENAAGIAPAGDVARVRTVQYPGVVLAVPRYSADVRVSAGCAFITGDRAVVFAVLQGALICADDAADVAVGCRRGVCVYHAAGAVEDAALVDCRNAARAVRARYRAGNRQIGYDTAASHVAKQAGAARCLRVEPGNRMILTVKLSVESIPGRTGGRRFAECAAADWRPLACGGAVIVRRQRNIRR